MTLSEPQFAIEETVRECAQDCIRPLSSRSEANGAFKSGYLKASPACAF